ncbi:Murein DD-endopeptidase MepM and murein hydrolase activator NlpD, contain LysM domain [Salinimicrobium catena]|uniref:Murein DD-endopeptidase MepM and murein hydrolase activator NlpD, contain LysM domain n=1 Tax=Salinimicrobium catena TaxID=390640 RepID=A0A1H5IH51_9FLAO|nr:M23 family metallopeptidase [Salinimicrobium catena]SDK77762.1 Murein DD-endopeptidase MepM and murein hydrolase activator NlpD, contain LysM domain [Salinimicrobium catena]SEE39552.1 Murein DD-endopeptidase MepM and murein hydrolase activator NlpD, contain LysM domain [Salinimicrobium catena]
MEENKEHKRKISQKLLDKYRLVILNDDTFEEKLSVNLTRLNVFVVLTVAVIVLIALTTVLIAFTGLREYIPGYSSTELKQRAVTLAYKTDSLQNVVEMNNQYINSIRRVLTGDVKTVEFNRDSLLESQRSEPGDIDLAPSKEDSLLREMVVQEDKYNFLETATSRANYALFPPLKGPVSEGYNIKDRHFGIDIVAAHNAPVKSVADGTVIFAAWTSQTGNVIIVEHSYGLLSVYKHNASLTKEQGERVKKGEVIATAGSTGEFSTGPHLHFELWSEGQPVNPTDFIDFQ